MHFHIEETDSSQLTLISIKSKVSKDGVIHSRVQRVPEISKNMMKMKYGTKRFLIFLMSSFCRM